jgi:hypothetical protein
MRGLSNPPIHILPCTNASDRPLDCVPHRSTGQGGLPQAPGHAGRDDEDHPVGTSGNRGGQAYASQSRIDQLVHGSTLLAGKEIHTLDEQVPGHLGLGRGVAKTVETLHHASTQQTCLGGK